MLDVLLKWPDKSAKRSKLTVYDATGLSDTYDAVKMHRFVNFSTAVGHPHPIVELLTTDQRTRVFMTIVDQPPAGEFGLIGLARRLTTTKQAARDLGYSGVVFPMVNFQEMHRLDWLLKLQTTNANLHDWPAEIFEAWQMNRVRMDDVGVRFESAASVSLRTFGGGGPEYYEVNAPFLLWAVRDHQMNPLMVAFVDRDGWKDPGGIG